MNPTDTQPVQFDVLAGTVNNTLGQVYAEACHLMTFGGKGVNVTIDHKKFSCLSEPAIIWLAPRVKWNPYRVMPGSQHLP